mmetsp:Transcript_45733/g.118321  ORF Transcript_45733/g.118321 Transcript_45733/m.118321 type:complete len:206 (-) Transcript_45733:1776-2393(-)
MMKVSICAHDSDSSRSTRKGCSLAFLRIACVFSARTSRDPASTWSSSLLDLGRSTCRAGKATGEEQMENVEIPRARPTELSTFECSCLSRLSVCSSVELLEPARRVCLPRLRSPPAAGLCHECEGFTWGGDESRDACARFECRCSLNVVCHVSSVSSSRRRMCWFVIGPIAKITVVRTITYWSSMGASTTFPWCCMAKAQMPCSW